MASQQPRPWSRFSILAGRPAPPAPPPPRPSAPPAAPRPPVPPRPSIPIRPTQTQAPFRPPPFQSAASPPAPVSVPPPPPALPSPVRAPSPQPSPQRAPPTAPAAPPAPAAAATPPPPAPPRSSPPPQETKSPRTSPVQKETLTTSTYAPFSSSVPKSPQRKSQAPSFTQKPITTPIPSPKIIKPSERTTAESPKLKPSSRPLPLTLAPAQIRSDGKPEPKIELQAIVEHHAIDKPVQMLTAHNNGIPSNAKREPSWNHKGTSKTLPNSEESEMWVITLAGENKGAVLELSPSGKKNYPVGNSPSLQKYGGQSSDKNGEQGKYRNKEKANGGMAMDYSGVSYFNSNVQGVNNSIVCNSAFRDSNPGIHLSMRGR